MRSVVVTLTWLVSLTASAVPAAAQTPAFIPPVDAEVSQSFRAPSHRYGPGHRGIDYEIPSGTSVRASADGTVSFAGSVGGQGRFVTVQHAGDIETTYSYLSAIEVAEGDSVSQDQVIGQSGAGHPDGPPALHFGAKKSGEYIDPLLLLGQYADIAEFLELAETILARSAGFQSAMQQFPALSVSQAVPLIVGPEALEPFRESESPLGTVVPQPTLGVDNELKRRDDLNRRVQEALTREPVSRGDQMQADAEREQARVDRQAAEAADWWAGLSESEQEGLISQSPQDLGDRVGIPLAVRDRANREALAQRIKFLEDRQERMEKAWEEASFEQRLRQAAGEAHHALPDTPILGGMFESVGGFDGLSSYERELAGAKALARELDRLEGERDVSFPGSDVFLMDFNTRFANGDGRAVVSIGNPETAQHIGRVIPGLNNNLSNFFDTTKKAADIQSGVIAENSSEWAAENSAVIAWLGYDPPNGFADGFFGDEIGHGSQELIKFTRHLRAAMATDEEDPSIHDYAHSFGSTVLGRAACRGMNVEDIVHLGSAGAVCSGSEQLRYGAERVWAGTALDDPIHLAAILAPLGPNPNWDPQVRKLPLGSSVEQSGHGAYFRPQTVGMDNLVRLQAGGFEAVE